MVSFMSWSYEEIKKRQKALDKKSPFYKDDLESIKEMLVELGRDSFYDKIFSSLIFFTPPLMTIKNNLSYYRSVSKFTNPILLKAFQVIEDYDAPELQKRLPKKDFVIEDYIEMIHEFAQTLPDPFKKEVKKYAHESYFQFSSSPKTEYKGVTFITRSPNYKPYYLIEKTKNIGTFGTMVHEIGHGIFMRKEANNFILYKLLGEVEGFFFDYLALQFLKRKEFLTQEEVLANDNFDDFSNSIYQYFTQSLQCHLIFQDKRFVATEKILKESLKYNLTFPLSQGYLELISSADFFRNTKYAFSYLVNLDLQNIPDLEKALYYLYKLRTEQTLELPLLLKKCQITFLDDNYASLKRVKQMHMKIDKHEKI